MELILARVFIRIIAFKQWLCSADILKLLQLQYMTYNINANLCLRLSFCLSKTRVEVPRVIKKMDKLIATAFDTS